MPITNDIFTTDPSTIVVLPNRQRKTISPEALIELQKSIEKYGILTPIIVQKQANKIILVAGERRLTCCKALNIPILCRTYETLDENETKVIELEENIKREDLHWRDRVSAIAEYHFTKKSQDISWNIGKTAAALSLSSTTISNILAVHDNVNSIEVQQATSITGATTALKTKKERENTTIVQNLLLTKRPQTAQADPVTRTYDPSAAAISLKEDFSEDTASSSSSIIIANFIPWSLSYNGPKFHLLHIDTTTDMTANIIATILHKAPTLLEATNNILIWTESPALLEPFSKNNFHILPRPLIWVKSDTQDGRPGVYAKEPKSSYETCYIISRGDKLLLREVTDAYAAPSVINPRVPDQKPIPMLRHFLSMFIDNSTNVLDPTCGSASALIAAEELGARSILGIEMEPTHAKVAKDNLLLFRRRARLG